MENLVFKPGKLTNTYLEGKAYHTHSVIRFVIDRILFLFVFCLYIFGYWLGHHQFTDDPLKQKARLLKNLDFF